MTMLALYLVLAAVLGAASALRLRTRRYLDEEDVVYRRLSPWGVPVVTLVATGFAAPFYAGQPGVVAVVFLVALVWSVTLAFIDLEVHRLPDALTLPAYPVAAAALALCSTVTGDWTALLRAAAGSGIGVVLYSVLVIVTRKRAGLGEGDIKLVGVLFALLAWFSFDNLLYALLAGFIIGGLEAVVLLVTRRASLSTHIALGPSIIAGAYLAALLTPAV